MPTTEIPLRTAYEVESLSIRNALANLNKPNEDVILVERDVFIVADGVSRTSVLGTPYPDPSPSRMLSEVCTKAFYDTIKECGQNDPAESLITTAIHRANDAAAQFNAAHFFLNDVPACSFLAGILRDSKLHIVSIGDCPCYAFNERTFKLVNELQTKKLYSAIREGTFERNELVMRQEIRNNPTHPLRWGVLDGSKSASNFFQYYTIELRETPIVHFCSDGVQALYDRKDEAIFSHKPETIINRMSALEAESKLTSDDKSVVCFKFRSH